MALIDDIQKSVKNAFRRADSDHWHTDFLRTGLPGVDYALGGGFGYGRISELFGNWSSGKTMVLYYALAQNQKEGGLSILFESEGAFTADFFEALGGDSSKLWVAELDTVEEFFDTVFKICKLKTKNGDLTPTAIGWDGIAATGTKHLMDVDLTTRDMTKAGLMSFGTQKITTAAKECRVSVIATNQIREKIGSMDTAAHTPGGRAWPFHSSQRVLLQFAGGNKTSLIMSKDGKHEIGRWIKGQVVKNKLGPPFRKFELPIYVEGGQWHPEGYPWATKLGIDVFEHLFYEYKNHRILQADGKPAITGGASGRYQIPSSLTGGEERKFTRAEWPTVVEEFPVLWTLAYDNKIETPDDDGGSGSGETDEGGDG